MIVLICINKNKINFIIPFIKCKFDKLNFKAMNKLFISILFLFAGTAIANAQSLSQNQAGNGDNNNRISVTVFPNPVADIVNVLFDRPVGEPIVETFNVNGQRIPSPGNGGGDGSNKTEIDLSNAAPGIYVIKVYDGNEIIHVQQILKN